MHKKKNRFKRTVPPMEVEHVDEDGNATRYMGPPTIEYYQLRRADYNLKTTDKRIMDVVGNICTGMSQVNWRMCQRE